MDVIIFVPFSVILILLFCGVGLATEAIKSFLDVFPYFLAAAIISIIVYAFHKLLKLYRVKKPSRMYSVCETVTIMAVLPGVVAFAGPTYIDHCKRWFTWFGDSLEVQILTYIGCVLLSGFLCATMAFLVPVKAARTIILFIPIVVPILIYLNSLSVTSTSYSNYVTTEIETEGNVQEYRVVKETKIFYPDIIKGDSHIPALSPIKYTKDVFKEGEIVYAVYNAPVPSDKNQETYITVSNGSIGGLVALANLEWLENPEYTYEIRAKEESPIYEEIQFGTSDYYYNGITIIGSVPQEEVLTVLKGSLVSSEPYLRVAYNGAGGYISRNCVEVVRIPVN